MVDTEVYCRVADVMARINAGSGGVKHGEKHTLAGGICVGCTHHGSDVDPSQLRPVVGHQGPVFWKEEPDPVVTLCETEETYKSWVESAKRARGNH